MTILSKLLSPISAQNFVHHFFLKEPLYIKGQPDKFAFLFNVQSFTRNLDRVDNVRAVFPLLRQATIRPADIADMVRAGASICITGLRGNKELTSAVASIKRELNYRGRISFRSYLSPVGRGFDMHFDARAATTLQIGGRKRWWYSQNSDHLFPTENSPHTELLNREGFRPPDREQMSVVDLGPGDFLHLPAGTWHCAEAQEDSLSLNLAFDHDGASISDALLDYLATKLNVRALNRTPIFSMGTEPWQNETVATNAKSTLHEVRQMLSELEEDEVQMIAFLKAAFQGTVDGSEDKIKEEDPDSRNSVSDLIKDLDELSENYWQRNGAKRSSGDATPVGHGDTDKRNPDDSDGDNGKRSDLDNGDTAEKSEADRSRPQRGSTGR